MKLKNKYIILILLIFLIFLNGCKDNPNKDEELIRLAVLENNPSFCDELLNKVSKDVCYMHLASWYENPIHCDYVSLRNNIEGCYFFLAIQMNNLSLCDKLRDLEGLPYKKEACYVVASIPNTKPNSRNEKMLDGKNIFNNVFITDLEQDEAIKREFNKYSN